jgi:shikimate dehydrogenase
MEINGKTEIFGVLGARTEHSFSPVIHNAAFQHLGVNCVFVPFSVAEELLEISFRGLQAAGVRGLAVIIPFKEKVLDFCSVVDEKARLIGAVNTIKFCEDGGIIGSNTDAEASARALRDAGAEIAGSNVLLLGAGGAARAIAYQMAFDGVRSLTIANRTRERAEALCAQVWRSPRKTDVRAIGLEQVELSRAARNADIIINCSAVGMFPDVEDSLLMSEAISENQIVFDIVYNPLETRLLREAQAAGAKTVTGDMMLIYQAIEQERIWLGVSPPLQVMKRAFDSAIAT